MGRTELSITGQESDRPPRLGFVPGLPVVKLTPNREAQSGKRLNPILVVRDEALGI